MLRQPNASPETLKDSGETQRRYQNEAKNSFLKTPYFPPCSQRVLNAAPTNASNPETLKASHSNSLDQCMLNERQSMHQLSVVEEPLQRKIPNQKTKKAPLLSPPLLITSLQLPNILGPVPPKPRTKVRLPLTPYTPIPRPPFLQIIPQPPKHQLAQPTIPTLAIRP